MLVRKERRRRPQDLDEEEDTAAHGDVLVVGLERLSPCGIEQVFEADANVDNDSRAHCRPLLKNYSVGNELRLWDCRLHSITERMQSMLGRKSTRSRWVTETGGQVKQGQFG